MNKYSTFYIFSGIALTLSLISQRKNKKLKDRKQFILRISFLVAITISLMIFYAPWIMIGLISLWLIIDTETLKSIKLITSRPKEDIEPASIGLFFFVFAIILAKIFMIIPNFY